ncbi:MAG: hypothetical protein C0616_05455 [Desulfuromonas sp.]|nr:MAG: hypothetical protein C0616_05455 [Desulfuromonas sp.]
MEPNCCWRLEQATPDICPNLDPAKPYLQHDRRQRFIECCLECHQFVQDLAQPDTTIEDLRPMLPIMVEETLKLRAEVRTLHQLIGHLEQQGSFLREVGQGLQTSLNRDEILAMAMTAITSGKGFGLNRAILLLVDDHDENLYGHMAVGPRDSSEAGNIWGEIHQREFSLREMAHRLLGDRGAQEKNKFGDLLQTLRTPLDQRTHLFNKVLRERVPRHIHSVSNEPFLPPEQKQALQAEELLLVPLVSGEIQIGLLLADNLITRRPISEADLKALETFAVPVAFSIERANLYAKLQRELLRTTRANRQLQEQQEQIVKMEKHSLVGQLSADLAHAIRNPLTILSAHARQLAQNQLADSSQRRSLNGIQKECRRLDAALQDVLALVDEQHPNLDNWDLNRALTQVYASLQGDIDLDQVSCHLDLQPGLPQLLVDYRQLSSCLQSLFRQTLGVLDPKSCLVVGSHWERDQVILTFSAPELQRLVAEPNQANCHGLALTLCARALETQHAVMETDRLNDPEPALVIRFTPQQERDHAPLVDC